MKNLIAEKQRRLHLHFGNRQIAWVPFWGLSKLRRRGLIFAGEIPGDMIEYDHWYERMLSAETFDQLAEMGFNLVVLPFSLGGCAEIESQEHEDFRTAAKLCAERGITALPYLQYQNILSESFPKQFSFWATHPDGKRCFYFNTGYRPTLCQSSDEFKEYFCGLIRKSQEYGAGGLWVDNSYLYPCICPDCRQKFSRWLVENKKEMLDQLHLIPEQIIIDPAANTLCSDPVMQAFHQFNMARNIQNLQGFEQEMRKWNPEGLFGSNPSLYRGEPISVIGVDLPAMLKFHDLIYLENSHSTAVYDGEIDGNYRGFTECEAFGVTAVSGAWKAGQKKKPLRTGLPSPEEIAPFMLEPLLFGGATGAFWLIREIPDGLCRSGKDKQYGYFEFPPMHKALAETMKIAASVPAETRNCAEIGVWFSADSWKFAFRSFEESCSAVTEALTTAGIPWKTVFDDMPEAADDLKLLIVPTSRIFSNAKIAALRKIADSGTKILLIGADSALLNEQQLRRNDSPLSELAGSSLYAKEEFSSSGNWYLLRDDLLRGEPFLNQRGRGDLQKPGYMISGKFLETVEKLIDLPFRIKGESVIASLRSTAEGKKLLLLLDYQTPAQEKNVEIRFSAFCSGYIRQPGSQKTPFAGTAVKIDCFKCFAMIALD